MNDLMIYPYIWVVRACEIYLYDVYDMWRFVSEIYLYDGYMIYEGMRDIFIWCIWGEGM